MLLCEGSPVAHLNPFLYSIALEQGFTVSTILPDVLTDFGESEVDMPSNFNDQFHGPIRLRQALALSLNVPAVYLLQRIGIDFFIKRSIASEFHSLETQRGSLGLGLALGNVEVSLFELVQGYGLFTYDGRFRSIQPYVTHKEQPAPHNSVI